MKYHYFTCDVFTDHAFGGNPLAVFPDASGLGPAQMQRIAREFNYSETTFVFPPESGHTRKVRIFTPSREVPFAGHPNIGTAHVLAGQGLLADALASGGGQSTVTFEEQAGVVPVKIDRQGAKISCELCAPEKVSFGIQVPLDLVAGSLSLSAADIVIRNHPPQVVSVGLPFVLVEVADRSVLGAIEIDTSPMKQIESLGVMPDLHVYCHSADEFDIRSRMFAPFDGIVEDPATGSANCALAGLLASLSDTATGDYQWKIAQGVEMGRPSSLLARAARRDGVVTDTWIGGRSVSMMQGSIELLDES